jgi:hypothetical protein
MGSSRVAAPCVFLLALAMPQGCSSSDEPSDNIDAGADTIYPLCGPTSYSCCCNGDVALHPVKCADDGRPSCPAGYRFIVDECPFYCRVSHPDASIETSTDTGEATSCDSSAFCCCDTDARQTPICTDAGPTCSDPGYHLVPRDRCDTECVMKDSGVRD